MTSLTPEQLADAVAKIADLAKCNDLGYWSYAARQNTWDYVVCSARDENMEICQPFHDGNTNLPITKFIATAPLMAQVIRQLWAEREANRAVIEQARDALKCCYNVSSWPADGSTDQDDAIAALDAALGRV